MKWFEMSNWSGVLLGISISPTWNANDRYIEIYTETVNFDARLNVNVQYFVILEFHVPFRSTWFYVFSQRWESRKKPDFDIRQERVIITSIHIITRVI